MPLNQNQNFWIKLLVILLLVQISHQQTLPQEELDALEWIIKNYNYNQPIQTSSVCTSYIIVCSNLPSGYHVTEIRGINAGSAAQGPPDSSLTELKLPELVNLNIYGTPKLASGTSILHLLKNVPNLYNLNIQSDSTFVDFPSTFKFNDTIDTYLTLTNVPLYTSLTHNVATSNIKSVSISLPLQSINLNATTVSSISQLQHGCLNGTFIYNSTNFPVLTTISQSSHMGNTRAVIKTNLSNPLLKFILSLNSNANPSIEFLPGSFVNAVQVYGSGNNNITILPVAGLSDITINELVLYQTLSNVDQWNTAPSGMTRFDYESTPQVTQFPQFEFPDDLLTLELVGNGYSGTIPNKYCKGKNGKNCPKLSKVNMQDNTNLNGRLPDGFCNHGEITLTNTGINDYPDCFLCYYDVIDPTLIRLPTTPIVPSNFVCPASLTSTKFGIINNTVTITGNNLGWGTNSTDMSPLLSLVTPNSIFVLNVSTMLSQNTTNVIFSILKGINFTINYYKADINIGSGGIVQDINGTRITILANYSSNLQHNVTFDGTPCQNYTVNNGTMVSCFVPRFFVSGQSYNLTLANEFTGSTIMVSGLQNYPTITSTQPSFMTVRGGSIAIIGNMGSNGQQSSSLTINGVPCPITSISSGNATCLMDVTSVTGQVPISIQVDGWTIQTPYIIDIQDDPAWKCMVETNNCSNNGVCDSTGHCVCYDPINFDGPLCIVAYPRPTSSNQIPQNGGEIQLEGNFGNSSVTNNVTVTINGVPCTNVQVINGNLSCTIGSLEPGMADVIIRVSDGQTFESKELVRVVPADTPPRTPCGENNRCNGHGRCINNTVCRCESGFGGDYCLSATAPDTSVFVDNRGPIGTLFVGDTPFTFEMVGVEELDLEDKVTQFIPTVNWTFNIDETTSVTKLSYVLNQTSATPYSNNPVIKASIHYSNTTPWEYTFGTSTRSMAPNTIKYSVSVEGWAYMSNIGHLRVVFKTKLGEQLDQCGNVIPFAQLEQDTQSLTKLLIVNDGTTIVGRFLDQCQSDGRFTYSRSQVLVDTNGSYKFTNQTVGEPMAVVYVGVNMPSCKKCLLDPDFGALVQVGDGTTQYDDCGKEINPQENKNWKIIVGVVVGVVGVIAITVGSVMYVKHRRYQMAQNKIMQAKLARLNSI